MIWFSWWIVRGRWMITIQNCSRYDAVNTILEKVRSSGSAVGSLRVGLVSFSGSANIILPLTELNADLPLADYRDQICSDSGATSYEDAFDTATELWADTSPVNPHVYMISYGLPQPSGIFGSDAAARRDGLEARNTFVETIKAKVLAVFLEPDEGERAEAQAYLEQIVTAKEYLKVVAQAGDLAAGLESLYNPLTTPPEVKVQSISEQERAVDWLVGLELGKDGLWTLKATMPEGFQVVANEILTVHGSAGELPVLQKEILLD